MQHTCTFFTAGDPAAPPPAVAPFFAPKAFNACVCVGAGTGASFTFSADPIGSGVGWGRKDRGTLLGVTATPSHTVCLSPEVQLASKHK
jgi:hypothetical protein